MCALCVGVDVQINGGRDERKRCVLKLPCLDMFSPYAHKSCSTPTAPLAFHSLQGLLLLGMCAFIFFFSLSWAGVFWVLLSELFSMGAKSPATACATAVLFLTGK